MCRCFLCIVRPVGHKTESLACLTLMSTIQPEVALAAARRLRPVEPRRALRRSEVFVDDVEQVVYVERLAEERAGATVEQALFGAGGQVGGDDDDRRLTQALGRLVTHRGEDLRAVQTR